MLGYILLKLGLVKISKEELFNFVEELYSKTVTHAQEKANLSEEKLYKSKFEIALFFHCTTIPIFQSELSDDTWEELRYLIQDDILLRGLSPQDRSTLKSIMNERFEIHNNGLYQNKGTKSFSDNYYKLLYDLFYIHPMKPIDEIKKLNKLDLDFHSRIRKQTQMSLLFKHIVPTFRKSAKNLARMTRR